MLWMGNQITTATIIKSTFIASLVSVIIPFAALAFQLKGSIPAISSEHENNSQRSSYANMFFIAGIAALLFVPVFKSITGLPPFMGMLLAMGMIWLLSELIDKRKDEEEKQLTSINHVLKKLIRPVSYFSGHITGSKCTLNCWISQYFFKYTFRLYKESEQYYHDTWYFLCSG